MCYIPTRQHTKSMYNILLKLKTDDNSITLYFVNLKLLSFYKYIMKTIYTFFLNCIYFY